MRPGVSLLNRVEQYLIERRQLGFKLHNMEQRLISFVRHGHAQDSFILVVCNFTPIVRRGYRSSCRPKPSPRR